MDLRANFDGDPKTEKETKIELLSTVNTDIIRLSSNLGFANKRGFLEPPTITPGGLSVDRPFAGRHSYALQVLSHRFIKAFSFCSLNRVLYTGARQESQKGSQPAAGVERLKGETQEVLYLT